MKIDFKKAEKKIKEFFKNEESLKFLNSTIITLEKEKTDILEKIKNLDFKINYDLKGVNFDKINAMTSNKESNIEKQIIEQVTKYENIVKEIEDTRVKIKELEIEQTVMKNIFNIFSEEYLSIIKIRYKDNYSQVYIAMKLNVSEKTYQTYRNYILKTVYNLLSLYNKEFL